METTKSGGIAKDIERAMEAFPPIWSHPSSRGATILTESELKVAEMVGLGMTNSEIGKAMFISPCTVRTHSKHIHAKCGIAGRAKLAIVMFNIWDKGLYIEAKKKREEIMSARAEAEAKRKSVLKEMVY